MRWFTLFFLCFLLAGCQAGQGTLSGSTKGEIRGNTLSSTTNEPLPVSISDLVDEPEAYIGRYLITSGDLTREQWQDCDPKSRNPHPGWRLSDGANEVLAAIAPRDLNKTISRFFDVTLVGRWLQWKGLMDCGTEAVFQEYWYLDVVRLDSPNPYALVPVLPSSELQNGPGSANRPGDSAEGTTLMTPMFLTATTAPGDEVASTQTPISEPAQIDGTAMSSQASATAALATAIQVPTREPTPDPSGPATTPLTSSPTPVDNGTFLQASPTSTIEPPIFPSATPTEIGPQVIFRMDLEVSAIETGNLGINETHLWTHEITSTKQLTVSVASDFQHDLAIAVRDPNGNLIAQQNLAANGEPEILGAITLLDPGIYDILISSPTGEPGYYAIILGDNDSYPYIFQGTLQVSETRYAVIIRESDHFWHFSGTAGQVIDIRAVPLDNSDLFLNLIGTDGISLIRFHDETSAGEPEQLTGFVFPSTGIYSLRIGEVDFGNAEYEIILTEG